jgi:hypothetical protein
MNGLDGGTQTIAVLELISTAVETTETTGTAVLHLMTGKEGAMDWMAMATKDDVLTGTTIVDGNLHLMLNTGGNQT